MNRQAKVFLNGMSVVAWQLTFQNWNLIGPQVNINQFQYLGKQMLVGFKYRQIIPSLLNNLSAVQLHTLVFPKT